MYNSYLCKTLRNTKNPFKKLENAALLVKISKQYLKELSETAKISEKHGLTGSRLVTLLVVESKIQSTK